MTSTSSRKVLNVGADGNKECGFPQDASALMSQMQPVGHCAGSIRVCENDLAI
jgi:hypothetical protein